MSYISRDDLLLEYLRKSSTVKQVSMEVCKKESDVTGRDLGSVLVKNGFIKQDDLVQAILAITDKSLVHEEKIFSHIPLDLLRELRCKISAETVESVYVATLCDEHEVASQLQSFFPEQRIEFIDANEELIEAYLEKIEAIQDSDSSKLDEIIRRGIDSGASDIHLIERDESYSLFYRRNGVLSHFDDGTKEEFLKLTARIKDLGKMDMAEKRIPQDGGFESDHNGRKVALRVATIPVVDGETVVLRVLDPESNNIPITKLGISNLADWMKGSRRLEGLNLICGMTGSGKTTTLAATVRELDRFEKAIYTAEDPVENRISFVRQLNINELLKLDYSRALKAFMRADPDVIIVGEVRDLETARNAIKAAETGHLVFATLHTNSIKGAVNRLRDLGVPQYELKSILRSVLAQTLIRTLCKFCGGTGRLRENTCPKCLGDGYGGRTISSECYYFKDEEQVQELFDTSTKKWQTLVQDAFQKMEEGVTDQKEMIRVFGPVAEDMIEEKAQSEGARHEEL